MDGALQAWQSTRELGSNTGKADTPTSGSLSKVRNLARGRAGVRGQLVCFRGLSLSTVPALREGTERVSRWLMSPGGTESPRQRLPQAADSYQKAPEALQERLPTTAKGSQFSICQPLSGSQAPLVISGQLSSKVSHTGAEQEGGRSQLPALATVTSQGGVSQTWDPLVVPPRADDAEDKMIPPEIRSNKQAACPLGEFSCPSTVWKFRMVTAPGRPALS